MIDAHHHVWDLTKVAYPWLTPESGVLNRSYSAGDLDAERRAVGVTATVLVQAADSFDDTDHMLSVAEATPWIAGVVGWVPLDDPAAARDALVRFADHPLLRGVRTLIQLKADADWLLGKEVMASLEHVAHRGLVFDIPANRHHLPHVVELARRLPDLTIVIDHLGTPPIAAGGWEPWASDLAACAEHANVFAKVSGFSSSGGQAYTVGAIQPYVDHAFHCFGSDRLMLGSDWPVCLLAADYCTTLARLDEAIAARSVDEQANLQSRVASRVYRLGSG